MVAGISWYWTIRIISMYVIILAEISIESSCLWLDHSDAEAFKFMCKTKSEQKV